MNEICGPIYYTFANDPSTEWRGAEKYILIKFKQLL